MTLEKLQRQAHIERGGRKAVKARKAFVFAVAHLIAKSRAQKRKLKKMGAAS